MFEQFFTPEQCVKIFEARNDFDWEQHGGYWAIVTPKTDLKLVGLTEGMEAMFTNKQMLDEHPNEFADMIVVPAYMKDFDGKQLHPVYPNRERR